MTWRREAAGPGRPGRRGRPRGCAALSPSGGGRASRLPRGRRRRGDGRTTRVTRHLGVAERRAGEAGATRVPGPGLRGRAGPVGGFSRAAPCPEGPRRPPKRPRGLPAVPAPRPAWGLRVKSPLRRAVGRQSWVRPGCAGLEPAPGPGGSPCPSPDAASPRSSKRPRSAWPPCVWQWVRFGDHHLPRVPPPRSHKYCPCRSYVLSAITKSKGKLAVKAV